MGALYDLPFGKGQPFLNKGLASVIFGGFKFNTNTSAHSGSPLSVSVPGDQAQICGPSGCLFSVLAMNAPIWLGILRAGAKTPQHWFNTAAFSTPALGTFGNSSRGVIRGPGAVYSDISLFKIIHIKEANVQFRAEAFNFVNHLNLGNPDTGILDSNFGVVSSGWHATRTPIGRACGVLIS